MSAPGARMLKNENNSAREPDLGTESIPNRSKSFLTARGDIRVGSNREPGQAQKHTTDGELAHDGPPECLA